MNERAIDRLAKIIGTRCALGHAGARQAAREIIALYEAGEVASIEARVRPGSAPPRNIRPF